MRKKEKRNSKGIKGYVLDLPMLGRPSLCGLRAQRLDVTVLSEQ